MAAKRNLPWFVILLAASLLFSCRTTDNAPVATEPTSQADSDSSVVAEPAPENLPDETAPEGEDFVVTEEVYTETFQKVETVIGELNSLIRNKNFDAWKEYLTAGYIETYSDPELLSQLSQSDRLKNSGIVLKNLKDYFLYVVVPSRANLRLDDLVFIDKSTVEAVMIIREQRITVYRLRLIDNEWKIDAS